MSLVAYDQAAQQMTFDGELPFWVADMLDDDSEDLVWWITKGLGAGGTYGMAIWHILMCFINIESDASWCVAPTFTQVQTTLLPTFTQVLADHFDMHEGQDFDLRRGSPYPQLTFWWGHHIDFFSANAPDRMVGPSISHCSGTEVGLWKKLAFVKSRSRVRCTKAVRRQYCGEGTPEGMNWWEKEANFPEGGRHPDPTMHIYRRFRLETGDNLHLPEGYVDNVLVPNYGDDPNRLISYRDGIFAPFQKGTAYWEFSGRNMVLDVKVSRQLPFILSWDFNKIPSWGLIQRQVFYKRGVRLVRYVTLDESSGKCVGLDDALAEFIARYHPEDGWDKIRIEIFGDCNGWHDDHRSELSDFKHIGQELRKYYPDVALRASRSNPSIRMRLIQHNRLFSYEQYVVAKWCVNTIRSYTQTARKDGTWDIDKPKGDDWTHYGDANGYALYQLTQGTDLEAPDRVTPRGINKRV